ncbi:MAG: bifunctional proline dehydrogenase/L-glutamate gamma-semialdehyde dehydrogenase PutA [Gammaproteobacteria bacterium]|nr:bifunctional proline dehydrogenase/L-glutamate gamma-semialdehyde dehydrogenase PutA [Gammaproteobacteria bacterium]MDH4310921.1 bifunctional proline dehydrogenase/L-glutamate gamma-semialdehyde dehydrogenase PutA [Gammaproteobacteria bacterium]MDH5272504.1 bifunctional proline dehydrogenase/L-glutamate gamma-semialdehyde dehydrogenase PutA [Gammaproteobacteria bacterium]
MSGSNRATPSSRFLFPDVQDFLTPVGQAINGDFLGDEEALVRSLADMARLDPAQHDEVQATARKLVEAVRRAPAARTGLDAFLRQYDLSSQEGVILMCLAEALLRIPDDETADRLIADKLRAGDWASHLGDSQSLFVNASTWGLMLTGRIVRLDPNDVAAPEGVMSRVVGRMGEPVVRTAMRQAMRIMGHQFVMGRTMKEALDNSLSGANRRYRYTFDMLGEAALTTADATRYFDAYRTAIGALAARVNEYPDFESRPSISVKLSAMHPRFERSHRQRVHRELTPRLVELCRLARDAGIALTLDTEESERLELTMELLAAVCRDPSLAGWNGFGIAVQTYQKRALPMLKYVVSLAQETRRILHVRLVKGAYWDAEIKRGQERGLPGYPLYTRKPNTDVSYLACARYTFEQGKGVLYPQFATHNAHTVAAVASMARKAGFEFEFQRLHGMGEELYTHVTDPSGLGIPCRVYAPVGEHEDLLPYLVRRLLENGSNTSFVNRIVNENEPIDAIIADPVRTVDGFDQVAHPRIPQPLDIYQPERRNSLGVHLANGAVCKAMADRMEHVSRRAWVASPLVGGDEQGGSTDTLRNPANHADVVGSVTNATTDHVRKAIDIAVQAQPAWDAAPAGVRGDALDKAADLFEESTAELVAMCVREAGKSVPDGIAEVREAVDFLRYYAARARHEFAGPQRLPGPTGESNELSLHGRGVFTCISPWNFPLAIFAGQVAAALAAGNAVLAKPAEQTPLVAAHAVRLMLQAGVPADVLHFLPGDGASVGAAAVADPRIAGVAFTGSTETARIINRTLAGRNGPIGTLIAETGGQNAMIVDSSALPEQVVIDAVQSAFNSAGQRCSALRVLCVQEDIAPKVKRLLAGYMEELVVGDPAYLETDVGPVIDEAARATLEAHAHQVMQAAAWHHRIELPDATRAGTFVAPLAVEIASLSVLEREWFGPIMHLVTYKARDLEALVDAINATGFGLTFGIHSRIDGTVRRVASRVAAGNVYVNRNIIGAVVGTQPFGGSGLSGTGPKAGGPFYLHRYAHERTLTINTSAVGGNASLLAME